MSKVELNFGDIKVKKSAFQKPKNPVGTNKVDNEQYNKILISNKVWYGKKGLKYFIGHTVGHRIEPSCMELPKKSRYATYFDKFKHMKFLIRDR